MQSQRNGSCFPRACEPTHTASHINTHLDPKRIVVSQCSMWNANVGGVSPNHTSLIIPLSTYTNLSAGTLREQQTAPTTTLQ